MSADVSNNDAKKFGRYALSLLVSALFMTPSISAEKQEESSLLRKATIFQAEKTRQGHIFRIGIGQSYLRKNSPSAADYMCSKIRLQKRRNCYLFFPRPTIKSVEISIGKLNDYKIR